MRPVNLLIVERDQTIADSLNTLFASRDFAVKCIRTFAEIGDDPNEETDTVILGADHCSGQLEDEITTARRLRPHSSVIVAVDACDPRFCAIWDKPSRRGCSFIHDGADGVILLNRTTREEAVKEVMVSISRYRSSFYDMVSDLREANQKLASMAMAG